ncbi:hypothetical protein Vafri_14039 [Volvox africanus]|nr:hypothetical protein Vafri_14039 [Volvox africanus]
MTLARVKPQVSCQSPCTAILSAQDIRSYLSLRVRDLFVHCLVRRLDAGRVKRLCTVKSAATSAATASGAGGKNAQRRKEEYQQQGTSAAKEEGDGEEQRQQTQQSSTSAQKRKGASEGLMDVERGVMEQDLEASEGHGVDGRLSGAFHAAEVAVGEAEAIMQAMETPADEQMQTEDDIEMEKHPSGAPKKRVFGTGALEDLLPAIDEVDVHFDHELLKFMDLAEQQEQQQGPAAMAMAAAAAAAGVNSKGSGRSKGASGGASRKSSHQAGSGARGGPGSKKEAANAAPFFSLKETNGPATQVPPPQLFNKMSLNTKVVIS